MALINCPACKQRISNKAKECPHCDYDLVKEQTSEGLSAEKLASQKKLLRMKQRYSLQMQAMAGIILFLLGAVLWYFDGRGFAHWSQYAEAGVALIGALWYLTTRVRQMIFKKNR